MSAEAGEHHTVTEISLAAEKIQPNPVGAGPDCLVSHGSTDCFATMPKYVRDVFTAMPGVTLLIPVVATAVVWLNRNVRRVGPAEDDYRVSLSRLCVLRI